MPEAGRRTNRVSLQDGAEVVVIGGGPAGSLFSIQLLRKARQTGRRVRVRIIEKKRAPTFCGVWLPSSCREGCNYCAGGISPRMADALSGMRLLPPDSLVQDELTSLTIQSEWKNIELAVPGGRRMFSVFRGSKPVRRSARYVNFDAFLLDTAIEEGSDLITGEVQRIQAGREGELTVSFSAGGSSSSRYRTIQANFIAIALGVNDKPGIHPGESKLDASLRQLMPGFRPPVVRRALIFELQADPDSMNLLKGEVCFIDYGSGDLQIEMSSLMPKGEFITGVLIGRTIDRCEPIECPDIIRTFMDLPHIRRLVPRMPKLATACVCRPNMTVGSAKQPYGNRVAVIGDLAVSRLYKDGIYSAYVTAGGLADAVLTAGIDRDSLRLQYWPVVRRLKRDNWIGRAIYFVNGVVFSRPSLSRIVYQAVLTERKSRTRGKRLLETILWNVVSGDDSYSRILLSMFKPTALWLIIVGGLLITLRNLLLEILLGLSWRGMARFPTGVYRESVQAKRSEMTCFRLSSSRPAARPSVERMYSIKIKANRERIWQQLGKLGDSDRQFLNPRLLTVARKRGKPNEVGSVIEYALLLGCYRFTLEVERTRKDHHVVYRILTGFARGGILSFDIEALHEGVHLLTIYTAFDFLVGEAVPTRLLRRGLESLFPAFLHDVVWNHALCKLKEVAEGHMNNPPLPSAMGTPQGFL